MESISRSIISLYVSSQNLDTAEKLRELAAKEERSINYIAWKALRAYFEPATTGTTKTKKEAKK